LLVQALIVVVVANVLILELAVVVLWRRRPRTAVASAEPDPGNASAQDPSSEARSAGPLIDPETGLETALVWSDALRHEDARRRRYGHPATVVVLELVGLEQLAERLGSDVADRLIVPVAATLLRNSRASDRVARVAAARFHVLMPETDEVAAINYIDRVRETTDIWLEAGAVAVRVAVGWASLVNVDSLADAVRLADERLQADRHTPQRPRTSSRSQMPEEAIAS
jgi:diguanylate cyclase (GGDEF)-like protein